MAAYFEYLKEMIVAFFQNLGTWFRMRWADPWGPVPNEFAQYNSLFANYSPNFGVGGWIFFVLFAILLLALIGGICFLIFWLIRKYVRFRKSTISEERLKQEVERLNLELYQTIKEKDRVLGLQVRSLGVNSSDLGEGNQVLEPTEEKKEETKKEAKAEQTSTSSKKKNGSYVINCSDSELDMLAAIVYCEAGGESYKGKLAVAAVVVNRVQSSRYPDNLEAVIKQKSQFSPVRSGRFAKTLKKGAPSSCYDAAIEALQGESPVGNAMSFRAGHSRNGIQIGNQYFF